MTDTNTAPAAPTHKVAIVEVISKDESFLHEVVGDVAEVATNNNDAVLVVTEAYDDGSLTNHLYPLAKIVRASVTLLPLDDRLASVVDINPGVAS